MLHRFRFVVSAVVFVGSCRGEGARVQFVFKLIVFISVWRWDLDILLHPVPEASRTVLIVSRLAHECMHGVDHNGKPGPSLHARWIITSASRSGWLDLFR